MRSKPFFYISLWLPVIFLFFYLILTYYPGNPSYSVSSTEAKEQEKEAHKSASEFGPNELFFLDRNYPDYTLNHAKYQELLKASIQYDQSATRTHRGLDAPWTLQGPGNIGGRINAMAVHPTDSLTIFIGYAQGGIYRTKDGGTNWIPVFDDQASLSISDIRFDTKNPDHLWATTGDVNISGYYFIGSGIYESINGGLNWHYKGLGETGILSKIAIDQDPKYIYVGCMGFPAQKGTEKGIYRTTNGGASWEKTLFIDDSTGIIDIVADKTKSGRVFATAYTRVRSNTRGSTMGPGTALYKSDDFGATWVNIHNGLPEGMHSRTSVEITNDGTLFVSYVGSPETGYCVGSTEALKNIYKSMDSGITWDTIPTAPIFNLPCDALGGFGWYFEAIKVNPEDPDDIFIQAIDLYRSRDGGLYWELAAPAWYTYQVHADKHDLQFAHGMLYLGTDGGAYRTPIDGSAEWEDIENIPSTQFYRTAWSPHTPDIYYGGAQDNGTSSGKESTFDDWIRIWGGDGFQPRFDVNEPDWMYALTQYGDVYFSEDAGNFFSDLTTGLFGARYWDMPFIQSPKDQKILYCGSNRVFRLNMNDTLREWSPISEDLTKQIEVAGGRYPAITAIAESPLDSLRIYAGTQDGLIWTTPDGGMNWINITDGTPGAFVTSIEASTINPEGVFATYSGYRDNDHDPYIFRSDDAGLNWAPIASDIPMMGVNNLFIMPASEDTILVVGTDGGVYVSFNAGLEWDRVGSNMPHFAVYDIDYNPLDNQLIAATFSRGIMTFPVDELQLETAVEPDLTNHHDQGVFVFPTIVSDYLQVKSLFSQIIDRSFTFEIIDVAGKIIQTENVNLSGDEVIAIRLKPNVIPGLCYLKWTSGAEQGINTFILLN